MGMEELDTRATGEESLGQENSDRLGERRRRKTRDGDRTHFDWGVLNEIKKPQTSCQKRFEIMTGRSSPGTSQAKRQPERETESQAGLWSERHARPKLEVNRATKALRPDERWNRAEPPGEQRSIEEQKRAQERGKEMRGKEGIKGEATAESSPDKSVRKSSRRPSDGPSDGTDDRERKRSNLGHNLLRLLSNVKNDEKGRRRRHGTAEGMTASGQSVSWNYLDDEHADKNVRGAERRT